MECPLLEDILDEGDRFAIMIDGANLYQAARALGFDIDYRSLLQTCARTARLVRACYYTALLDDQEYSPVRPLIDWLDYNGYTVVTKPLKEFVDATGGHRFKGNLDVELAIDAMELAPRLNHLLLFTGNGTFRRLVEALQRQSVGVTVVSTVRTKPAMVADELRRQADTFLELQELAPWIARERRSAAIGEDVSKASPGDGGAAHCRPLSVSSAARPDSLDR